MSIIKKKDFEQKSITELVTPDGSPIEGDRNVTNNSEIETGPVQAPFNDNSGYEKGTPTTTNRATRYRQPNNWNKYFGGTTYSHGVRDIGSIIEDKVSEEFLNSKSNDNEVLNKNNNISDLESLKNPAAINKTKEFLNVIGNNNMKGEQVAIMLNYILTNINVKTIPNNYKNILIKKLR